ncbi:MAG: thioredoxin family protein [Thermoleophilaceae bacterium]
MRAELLWWEGCPSYPEALSQLRSILAEEGADAQVELREVESDGQAERERFPGSPTIRIDGEDVAPVDGEPLTLTCRVYRLRDGRPSPLPDPADVRAKVRKALGKEG